MHEPHFLTGTAFLGNPLSQWIVAVSVALAVLFLLLFLRRLAVKRLGAFAEKTTNRIDDLFVAVLARTQAWFLFGVALYAGGHFLRHDPWAVQLKSVAVVLALLQAGIWMTTALTSALQLWLSQRRNEASIATVISAASFLGKFLVWVIVLLLILDNLGVKVVSLLAGLGVGGIAVALAVQNVLGDLLASVSIVLDKPFEIGDFIVVGDMMGTVEKVGLKTTRVRSLSGELLVFSNGDLLGSRIRNFKHMKERRVVFSLGVTYQTKADSLQQIPGWIRTIIESQQGTRFERAHFQKFGDFALIFEVVYWVTNPDFGSYMDIQQAINFAIQARFESAGVEFAYPTQVVVLAK